MSDIKQNNTVSKSEAMRALTQFYNSTKDHFNKVIALKKHLFLSDVSVEVVNETKAAITYTSTMAYSIESGPFSTTDFWMWGMDKGKCGAYAGQYVGQDAASQLNTKTVVALKPTGILPFLTNIETKQIRGENTATPVGSPYPYYLFYSLDAGNNNPNVNYPCLSPDEMNWYYNGIISLISNYPKPTGKQYISHNVSYNFTTNTSPPNWVKKRHLINIKYGQKLQIIRVDQKPDFISIN